MPVLAAELFGQAGGQGALGGQVIFQVQDPPRGGQGVPLVEQLPDPGGEGQLAAGMMRAMDETELTQDEVNDLPGDERDAGWDPDEEYERVR